MNTVMTYLEQPVYCLLEQRLTKALPFKARAYEERPNRCVHFVCIGKSDGLTVMFCNPATSGLFQKILVHFIGNARRVRQRIFSYRQPYP